MIDNKRGFAPILLIIIAATVLAFILVALVLFSGTTRYIIIGVGILIGSFWLIGQMMTSSVTKPKMILLVIILLIGVGFIFSSNFLNVQFGSDRYVEIPFFASVECQQSGTSKSFTGDIPIQGDWISDNFPKNTNEWSVTLFENNEAAFGSWLEYYICPSRRFSSSCIHIDEKQVRAFATDPRSLGAISSDNYIWVQKQKSDFAGFGRDEFSGGTYSVTYKPFKLIRDDPTRGGRQTISDTCEIATSDISWYNRLISSSDPSLLTWGGSNSLQPGDFYNYVTTNIVSVAEGNTQNGGWCIYENNNANVFKIDTITTDSNSYNVVNFDQIISRPECCNNMAIPGGICENGNFIPIAEAQCSSRDDCGITEWVPGVDSTTVQRPLCVNNQCVIETKSVDCTFDSQCSTNQFCSRNSYTCLLASDTDVGEGKEREITSLADCIAKAEDSPLLGWTWVESSTEVGKGPLGIGALFGQIKVTTEGQCKPALAKYWVMGGLGILVIIILGAFLIPKKKKKGRKKKK